MSAQHEGFTIRELETLSGFDRRTIAYYSQEGLLPKVGRRGRGTVYPAAFKERLMFIRAVRDLQDAGTLRAITLAEIKEVMAGMDTASLTDIQQADDRSDRIRALFIDPDWDTRDIAVPVETVVADAPPKKTIPERNGQANRTARQREASRDKQGAEKSATAQELIQMIEKAVQEAPVDRPTGNAIFTRTTAAPLSDHVTIQVQGLPDSQAFLLQELLARILTER